MFHITLFFILFPNDENGSVNLAVGVYVRGTWLPTIYFTSGRSEIRSIKRSSRTAL